jgi:rod shape-determining protein MreC
MRYFFNRNRRLFTLLAILALAFVLVSVNLSREVPRPRTGPVETLVFWLVSPIQKSAAVFRSFGEIAWYRYIYLVNLREKNELLAERIVRLESQIVVLREKALSAGRLEELLAFRAATPLRVVAARVIGGDGTGWSRTLTLDRGAADGIALDMPVVVGRGVVGRVIKVHSSYSRVLLVVDTNSAVDAVVQRTRDKGIIAGTGGPVCEMKYVDRQSEVAVGDVVVTSGASGGFPEALVLGEVAGVDREGPGMFLTIKVRPAVDVNKVEEVLVILREKR